MRTVVLRVAFDGTHYNGMQNQRSAPSIQAELERALFETISYETRVVAAGRTDAGVHARGMVAHARVQDSWSVPEESIRKALNTRLPRDIRVTGAQLRMDDLFHARFDAIAREYSYTLMNYEDPLTRLTSWQSRYRFDPELLNKAAAVFPGVHNFTTFSKLNEEVKSYICKVEACEWHSPAPGVFRLRIKANRFVYGMVRSVVGAMMDAARKRRSVENLAESLAAENRALASSLAPARGLVFEQAYYPEDLGVQFV